MLRRAWPTLLVIAALLISCSGLKEGELEILYGAPPEKPIIELKAVAKDNLVAVGVGNYLDHEIPVSCDRFALIIRDGEVLRWDDKTMVSRFPTQILQPGQKASGLIRFKNMGNMVGYRLVFNPATEDTPVFTDIKDQLASPFDNPNDLITTGTLSTNPLKRKDVRKTPPALQFQPLK
jgi:hypothetical protein